MTRLIIELAMQVYRHRRCGGTNLMHLRAEYQGILAPITYSDLTPGKLEEQLKNNPPANSKEVKKVKRLIRLSKEEESE